MKKSKQFNISLLGESTVGKTSLVNVYTKIGFSINVMSNIGIDSYIEKKNLITQNINLRFLILLDKKDIKAFPILLFK